MLLRIFFGKTGVVFWRYIAQVAHEVHHFMVAEHAHHAAACLFRLGFQRHDQVHHFSRPGTAIDQVSDLNENSGAAMPTALLVDKAGLLKNGHKVIEIAVDVSDGNSAGLRSPEIDRNECAKGNRQQQVASLPQEECHREKMLVFSDHLWFPSLERRRSRPHRGPNTEPSAGAEA